MASIDMDKYRKVTENGVTYNGWWGSKKYTQINGTYVLKISDVEEGNEENQNVSAILHLKYGENSRYKPNQTIIIELEGFYRLHESDNDGHGYLLRQKDFSYSQYIIIKFNRQRDNIGGKLKSVYPEDDVEMCMEKPKTKKIFFWPFSASNNSWTWNPC